jgi:hypothetical protein
MPTTNLDTSDIVELAELLQFLHDWLATDPTRLGESLNGFVRSRAYDLGELQADLNKFIFLLGASDGESLFGPESD